MSLSHYLHSNERGKSCSINRQVEGRSPESKHYKESKKHMFHNQSDRIGKPESGYQRNLCCKNMLNYCCLTIFCHLHYIKDIVLYYHTCSNHKDIFDKWEKLDLYRTWLDMILRTFHLGWGSRLAHMRYREWQIGTSSRHQDIWQQLLCSCWNILQWAGIWRWCSQTI